MSNRPSQLEQLASQATTLYSRPTVAMELLRLTEQPAVDARELKNCVAQDPALACKLLRVVNSSLFGLSRPVADLNQAIGLLGIKPLKLLVLGFTLPDTLFAGIAARQLQWYWTNTLTRAVAARLLSEQLWKQSGDEAFTAGLLHDIGILVLLHELGEPYARFVNGVIEENCSLSALEQDTLGFDHVELSAALLERWQLPQRLVAAVETPKRTARLTRLSAVEGELPQILHLADLLVKLVGQRQYGVLAELMEAGKLYRGMTKPMLIHLVECLQPQVNQLAEVLALELSDKRDYVQVLLEAQQQMGRLGEEIASEAVIDEDERIYELLLTQAADLTAAMQSFLAGRQLGAKPAHQAQQMHAPHADQRQPRGVVIGKLDAGRTTLIQALTTAAIRCRDLRQELSLLLVEGDNETAGATIYESSTSDRVQRALALACDALHDEEAAIIPHSNGRLAVVLANCERRAAINIAHSTIREFGNLGEPLANNQLGPGRLSIGVATIGAIPKNFDAARLVESATRCLAAARAGGLSAVKSIEA